MDKPDPKLAADCRLDFEIDWFSTKSRTGAAGQTVAIAPASDDGGGGSQLAEGQQSGLSPSSLPKVYLNARFTMTHLESRVILFNKAMEFNYDFANELDVQIQSMRRLDNFYKKIAQEVTREVNQFLAVE